MMFLAYPFLALLDLSFTLTCCLFVNWWAPLFCDDSGNLPRWLKWAQTFDASLDAGWRDGYFDHGSLYRNRVAWLYRNPGYGFGYWVLGCAFDPAQWRVIAYRPDGSLFFAIGPGGRFNLCGRIGLRFKFGWKAWNMWDGAGWKSQPWGPNWRIPICCTISR